MSTKKITKRAPIVKKNVARLESESGINASINLPRDIDCASKSGPPLFNVCVWHRSRCASARVCVKVLIDLLKAPNSIN